MISNNIYQDVLHPRRATLNYISPAICEAIFSGSSFATLVLESNSHALTPVTGFRYNYNASNGTWSIYWDNYPNGICYNVYAADNPADPNTTFTLVAECLPDPVWNPPTPGGGGGGGNPPPGTPGSVIVITVITTGGESPFPNTPPPPLPPPPGGGGGTTFFNVEYTATCPDGFSGAPVTIPAHTYSSILSQADANQQAVAAAEFALSCTPNDPGECAIFDGLVWGVPTLGDPTSSGTFSGNSFDVLVDYAAPQGFAASVLCTGTVNYTGVAVEASLDLVVSSQSGNTSYVVTVIHSVTGQLVESVSPGVGTHHVLFSIPDSVGATITVTVSAVAGTGDGDTQLGISDFSGGFSCGPVCVADTDIAMSNIWVENTQPPSVTLVNWSILKSQFVVCPSVDAGGGFDEFDGELTVRYAPDFSTDYWLPAESDGATGVTPQLNINGMATSDDFGIVLNFVPLSGWYLEFYGKSGGGSVLLWSGVKTVGGTPAGTYMKDITNPGCEAGPECIHVQENLCVEDAGTPVPAEWGSNPAQIRIQGYEQLKNQFGLCATCGAPTTEPEWDGTFTVQNAPDAFTLRYGPTGTDFGLNESPPLKIGNARLNNTAQSPLVTTYISLNFQSGSSWELEIDCRNAADNANIVLWQGTKAVGDGPAGTYMRRATTQSSIGPACVVVESY